MPVLLVALHRDEVPIGTELLPVHTKSDMAFR